MQYLIRFYFGAGFPADSAEFPGFLCGITYGLDSVFERQY